MKDQAIEEIRKVRKKISEEFPDMASFIKHYQELEKKYSNRFVFHEKELIISVLGQKHPQSNWQKISDALKEADSLDIPRKNYKVILAELREMREL